MALKSPASKIESSLATFLFAVQDLDFLAKKLNWEEMVKVMPLHTGKSSKNYSQLIEQTTIAVCAYHVEILQEALVEFINEKKINDNSLYVLQKYLYLLRCALMHSDEKLLAKWEYNRKNPTEKEKQAIDKLKKNGITIKIPIDIEENNHLYNEKSKQYKPLKFKIYLNSSVRLTKHLLNKLILLSYHILTLTRKKTLNTINAYLKRTSK